MSSLPSTDVLRAAVLDRRGGATEIDATAIQDWAPEDGVLWVHAYIDDAVAKNWIIEHGGMPEAAQEILVAEATRPRSLATDDGLLVVLRGVNTNPGSDPEDMVAIRVWLEPGRIITTWRRRLLSIADVRDSLTGGQGPVDPGSFLVSLVGRLADRIGDVVDDIEGCISEAEDALVADNEPGIRQSIANLRRQAASVRRFLAPQRDALDRLYRQPGDLITGQVAQELREESDRMTRYLEDLDLAREKAMVLQEEYLAIVAQQQNSRMYVLSVVAAIFLPLTFVTGLLGMNVGGLPGLDNPKGFLGSVVVMAAATAGLVSFFRWKKWL